MVYHVINGLSLPVAMTSETTFTWRDLPSGIAVMFEVAAVSTTGLDGERSVQLAASTLVYKGQLIIY